MIVAPVGQTKTVSQPTDPAVSDPSQPTSGADQTPYRRYSCDIANFGNGSSRVVGYEVLFQLLVARGGIGHTATVERRSAGEVCSRKSRGIALE